MLDKLIEWDKSLFFYLNDLHQPWLDPIMFWMSQTRMSIPLFAFLLFLTIKYYRKNSWMMIVAVAITVLMADQITSGLMKPYFLRYRPSHDPEIRELVHTVNGYLGGTYGFASSHAANTFGVACYFWLLLRHQSSWIVLLFAWAILVSYTRIYLGVHFPGDVITGAIIGCLCGYLGYQITRWLQVKFAHATFPEDV